MKKIIISIIGLALILSIYSCKKDKDTPDGLIMQESEMIKRSRKVISLILMRMNLHHLLTCKLCMI